MMRRMLPAPGPSLGRRIVCGSGWVWEGAGRQSLPRVQWTPATRNPSRQAARHTLSGANGQCWAGTHTQLSIPQPGMRMQAPGVRPCQLCWTRHSRGCKLGSWQPAGHACRTCSKGLQGACWAGKHAQGQWHRALPHWQECTAPGSSARGNSGRAAGLAGMHIHHSGLSDDRNDSSNSC